MNYADILIKYGIDTIFCNGLAAVKSNNKWGYIDELGEIVIPCIYDECHRFIYHIASVKLHGKWGLITSTGKEIVPCIYDNIHGTISGSKICIVQVDGKYGLLDIFTDTLIVPCKYDIIAPWDADNMIFAVQRGGKWGLLTLNNIEIVPCKYTTLECFVEGIVYGMLNEVRCRIDITDIYTR